MTTDNPDEIFLNPSYVEKLKQQEHSEQMDNLFSNWAKQDSQSIHFDWTPFQCFLDSQSDPMDSSLYRE